MVERTQAAHLVPEALLQVKSADSHAACLQALLHLQQLCCDHQVQYCWPVHHLTVMWVWEMLSHADVIVGTT